MVRKFQTLALAAAGFVMVLSLAACGGMHPEGGTEPDTTTTPDATTPTPADEGGGTTNGGE